MLTSFIGRQYIILFNSNLVYMFLPFFTIQKFNNVLLRTDFKHKKLKAKVKYADKLKIPYIVIIGEDEVNSNKVL